MPDNYQCNKCGTITRATHQSSPQRGDYERVKCQCGNKGSTDYDYRRGIFIAGFTRIKEKSDETQNS